MQQCCAIGCRNIGNHKFPTDPEIRKQWEIAVGRKHFTKSSRLCSAHFRDEDYSKESFYTGLKIERKLLKKGAIPSLFVCSKKLSTKANQRKKRCQIHEEEEGQQIIKTEGTSAEIKCYPPAANNIKCTIKMEVVDVGMEVEVSDVAASSPTSHDLLDPLSTLPCEVGTQKNFQFFSIGTFMKNNKAIKFYTGFESYDKFQLVFSTFCPEVYSPKYNWSLILSMEDQFFLTLIKLRRNNVDFELALFFDISPTLVSNIFVSWINFMHQMWSTLNTWPSKDLVEYKMPEGFQITNPTVNSSENIPAVLKGRKQLPETIVRKDRKLTSKHKHIEHLPGQTVQTKTFRFLQEPIICNRYLKLITKINYVCQMLCKFKESIVPQ